MSHKTISDLPDLAGFWLSMCNEYHASDSVQINFQKHAAQAKAFSVYPCVKISILSCNLNGIGGLIKLNTQHYFNLEYLKRRATDIKTEMDICFEEIKQNKDWAWYYKNKDTALFKEAYDILNKVINY